MNLRSIELKTTGKPPDIDPLQLETQTEKDLMFMNRCVELSYCALENLDMPVGCIIVNHKTGKIISEAENEAFRNYDMTLHAEIVAMKRAWKQLGTIDLSECTIYSTMEPCVMCALMIRESRIGRVVYSISSPVEGGNSRFNVLEDSELDGSFPKHFGASPEIVKGLQIEKAQAVWDLREQLKANGKVVLRPKY